MAFRAAILSLITFLVASLSAHAGESNAFTYQGRLMDAGEPANGTFNIDIGLWDAVSSGTQLGTDIMFNSLPVSEGLITVELDFGADVFNGNPRWLQLTVNGFELAPRQAITKSPYSIQTRGIFVDESGNVGIRTTSPGAKLQVGTRDGASLNVGANPQLSLSKDTAAGKFRMQLSGGGFSGNVLQLGRDDGNHDIVLSGSVGVGTMTPGAYAMAVQQQSSAPASGLRLINGDGSHSLQSWIGTSGAVIDAEGTTDLHLRTGGIDRMFVENATGKIGVGTLAPGYRFHVVTGSNPSAIAGENFSNGANYGVYGTSASTSGIGVYGRATASSGETEGVRGLSESDSGGAGVSG